MFDDFEDDEELPDEAMAFLDALGLTLEAHEECNQIKDERNAAIEAALHEHQEPCQVNRIGNLLVSKWVTVAEYVDEEGRRRLLMHAADDAYPWDVKGMLQSVQEAL